VGAVATNQYPEPDVYYIGGKNCVGALLYSPGPTKTTREQRLERVESLLNAIDIPSREERSLGVL